jgi:hypothetical protein
MSLDIYFRTNRRDKRMEPLPDVLEFDVWSEDEAAIRAILSEFLASDKYVVEKHTMRYLVQIQYKYTNFKGLSKMLKRMYDLQGG